MSLETVHNPNANTPSRPVKCLKILVEVVKSEPTDPNLIEELKQDLLAAVIDTKHAATVGGIVLGCQVEHCAEHLLLQSQISDVA